MYLVVVVIGIESFNLPAVSYDAGGGVIVAFVGTLAWAFMLSFEEFLSHKSKKQEERRRL